MSDTDWTVWGTGRDPLFVGTEESAKNWVIAAGGCRCEDEGLYIEPPQGGADIQYDFINKRWEPAS